MGRGTMGGAELARGTSCKHGNVEKYILFMMAERYTEGETPLLRLKI